MVMKVRILLALDTGLRRGDIDSLKISDVDFETNSISTSSRKTKKSMASRPVLAEVMVELSKYVCSLDVVTTRPVSTAARGEWMFIKAYADLVRYRHFLLSCRTKFRNFLC